MPTTKQHCEISSCAKIFWIAGKPPGMLHYSGLLWHQFDQKLMNTTNSFAIFGAFVGCYGAYRFVLERVARNWPTVIGTVVELPAQSFFERQDSNTWGFNTDSDHFMVWSVDGKEYRKRIEDKASAHVGGIKVWRKTAETGDVEIRYHPKYPNFCFMPDEAGSWKLPMAVSALILIGSAIAYGYSASAPTVGTAEVMEMHR